MSKLNAIKFNPLSNASDNGLSSDNGVACFTSDVLIWEANPPKESTPTPEPANLPSGKPAQEYVKFFDADKKTWVAVNICGDLDSNPLDPADEVQVNFEVYLGCSKGHIFFMNEDISLSEEEAIQSAEYLADKFDECEDIADALLEVFEAGFLSQAGGYKFYKK